jgi:DNA (cytosine-5)-methyltransferase 1
METSVMCLNDQGGQRMDLYEDVCGTLRSQMDGHPPLVLGTTSPVLKQEAESYCISGNIIDRETHNGGNGFGYQTGISYSLTATDRHAVFSQQISETYQQTIGTIGYSDHKGVNSQFVSEDKCIVEKRNLIRRLTPMECERLQGFPDGWTNVAGGSDSARYKALGNSVAIPCVTFLMQGIVYFLRKHMEERV